MIAVIIINRETLIVDFIIINLPAKEYFFLLDKSSDYLIEVMIFHFFKIGL